MKGIDMYEYKFREHFRRKGKVSANLIAEELIRLKEEDELTASGVVEAARSEESVLHSQFLWDDTEAGHRYRLIEARNLIRAIVIIPKVGEKKEQVPQSLFVHVPDKTEREGKYVPLAEVIEVIDEYERAIMEAQRRLISAEQGFMELRQLAEQKGGKAEALAIAVQGFATIKEALALLKVA